MRTKRHWEECNSSLSTKAAHKFALQLKEKAKTLGYDPKGIKVFNKQQVFASGASGDSQVVWNEGPLGWAHFTEIIPISGVCYEVEGCTISFYDI